MAVTDPRKPRCRAHNRQGGQCQHLSIPGGTVCRWHGGASPVVKIAAAERLRRMQPHALDVYQDLLDDQSAQIRLATCRDLFDRTGLGMEHQADGAAAELHVTVTFDRAEVDIGPTLALDGHTPQG